MLRWSLIASAALALLSSANACRCVLEPLAACDVGDNQAALLVTIQSVTTVVTTEGFTDSAVAGVVIDDIFEDNTGFGLAEGDVVSITSLLEGATCGLGRSFSPGDQWILFAGPTFQWTSSLTDTPFCNPNDADLETNTCAGKNVRNPTKREIKELAKGCGTSVPIKDLKDLKLDPVDPAPGEGDEILAGPGDLQF